MKNELIERWNYLDTRSLELLNEYSDFSAYLKVRLQMDIVELELNTKYNYKINEGME